MFSLLLVIIYLAVISLGLPDSLLGSAWPVMHIEFDAPYETAGVISMIITGGTIVSSLASNYLTHKLGTGLITALSVASTAAALFGFSISNSVIAMCLWAVPYGLGAGGVDAALNNYVALHYSSKYMCWFHCFWGVGASISPYIMSAALTWGLGWRMGYRSVSVLQVILTVVLFAALPVWKKAKGDAELLTEEEASAPPVSIITALKIRGVPYILLAFFSYCSLEMTAILWTSSYLAEYRAIEPETAAAFASLFYLGITFGRFLNGFVADRVGDRNLIRIGIGVLSAGIILVLLPFASNIPALVGLIIIGFGCAPIYPSIIHATPSNFGRENSQAIVGIQMASAYTGSTLMPPVFGLLAGNISMGLFPVFLAVFAVLMLVMTELLNAMFKGKNKL